MPEDLRGPPPPNTEYRIPNTEYQVTENTGPHSSEPLHISVSQSTFQRASPHLSVPVHFPVHPHPPPIEY